MLELLGSLDGPVVELSVTSNEVSVGEQVSLEVNATAKKGTIVKLELKEGNILLEEKSVVPIRIF